ncbi:endonuclease/exonuclease/phosphatase family protein [Streptomyces sp. NPDC051940]|uniref:endonuclease/exonuclease/phosphatase family protein n=1 Tax=Streptomyces sp. NPDC051940 TaxID=3155675 RepID=UPI00342DFC01
MRRWRRTLLTALLLTAATAPTAHAGDEQEWMPLRVATYNIAAGANSSGVFDPAGTAETLRSFDADVIALEEVDVHWSARSQWRDLAAELADQLGMRVFFGPIYSLDPLEAGLPRREFGVAILSRLPVESAENHLLTRLSTQVPNPVPEPAPGFPEVVVKMAGVPVHVYATHLDYRADPAVRRLQVADTLRIMAEDCHTRCPQQILAGDLNAVPTAPELAPLWQHLTDAAPPAPGYTYPAAAPVRRIDYVTVAGGIGVLGAHVPQTLASDHRPVVADLLVRR